VFLTGVTALTSCDC